MDDHKEDRSLKLVEKTSNAMCSQKMATTYAAMFFGCYRVAEASEPSIYLAAVKAVFAHYPESVVQAIADPFNGLPSKKKFLPSIAEIKKACEKANGTYRVNVPDGMVYGGHVYHGGQINFLAETKGRKIYVDED